MHKFQPEQTPEPEHSVWGTTQLPLTAKVGVYARQSSLMQVKNYKESTEMQTTDLIAFAHRLGWTDELIILFNEDLGVSGKLRIDQREGLRSLVDLIQQDTLKAVIVFLEDRLFRDETAIQVNVFIELCKEHGVLVLTPHMTYDFSNVYHVKQFRWKCEAAADFLREYVAQRLHGAKARVSERGDYDGRGISVGFIVDRRERIVVDGKDVRNPQYMKFMVYEPHAEVVRWLFQRYFELGGKARLLYREIQTYPVLFPAFPQDADKRDIVKIKLKKVPGGYHISYSGLRDLLVNIAYIGWWIYHDRVVKNNHNPVLAEDLFWYAFTRLSPYTPDGEVNEQKPIRTRYQRIASEQCQALLKDCIDTTPEERGAYVTYKFRGWYYILRNTDAHVLADTHITTIPVAILDEIYTQKLVEHLQATKQFEHYHQYAEQAQIEQEKECVSIQAQLKEIEKQLAGIVQSLMLPPDILDEVAQKELARKHKTLQGTKEELQRKIESTRGNTRAKELLEYRELVGQLAPHWHELSFVDKKILVDALTELVVFDEITPHFLHMTIYWRDPQWGEDSCTIWRKKGPLPTWKAEEDVILRANYYNEPQEAILTALPRRSWQSVMQRASQLGIHREVSTYNTCTIPKNITFTDWHFIQENEISMEALSKDILWYWHPGDAHPRGTLPYTY